MEGGRLLVDTNIISYLLKENSLARPYLVHLKGNLLFLSFISVGELYFWAEDASWGPKRRAHLEEKLRNYIVIPYDYEIARCYARIAVERKHNGKSIDLHDAWIAACAIRHGIPLVTHNVKDFEGISFLKIITEAAQ